MTRGLRLESKKENLIEWTIRRTPPPARVIISLSQCQGASPIPCVKVGTKVRVGEKIAEPSSLDSVALHASLSGEVKAIGRFSHPLLEEAQAIEILSDGHDEKLPSIGHERADWQRLSPEVLQDIFQESGLLDFGIETRALHTKAREAECAKIETLILNGLESEPYVTSLYALLMSHPIEILKGADLMAKAAGAKRILMVVGDDKLEAAELLKSKIFFHKWNQFEVEILPTLFPQGDERLLLQRMSARRKEEWKGSVFHMATAFATHEAVVLQKPFYERAVTVAGECVIEPKNLWLRLGTSFQEAIKVCRGLLRDPEKVLMGGPMKGIAQLNLETPTVKATQAILALPREVVQEEDVQPCIRCGRCIEVCPVDISPAMITLAAEQNLFEVVRDYGGEHCIECGNCAYICPSHRPMLELIRYGMRIL